MIIIIERDKLNKLHNIKKVMRQMETNQRPVVCDGDFPPSSNL